MTPPLDRIVLLRCALRGFGLGLLLFFVAGCASTSHRTWGDDATLVPGWSTIKQAAWNAAADPKTWLPLAGASLVYATDKDVAISSWAASQKPVFGNDAGEVSDRLKRVADVSFTVTALMTDSGDEPLEWVWNKAKGFAIGNAAFAATAAVTDLTKEQVGRMRPNGANTRSFISGHTSYAASRIALAMRNVEQIEMGDSSRNKAAAGLYTISAGMAWARVEDGAHYPSDVLTAMAVGNFIANFVNDAFLVPLGDGARVSVLSIPQGNVLVVSLPF